MNQRIVFWLYHCGQNESFYSTLVIKPCDKVLFLEWRFHLEIRSCQKANETGSCWSCSFSICPVGLWCFKYSFHVWMASSTIHNLLGPTIQRPWWLTCYSFFQEKEIICSLGSVLPEGLAHQQMLLHQSGSALSLSYGTDNLSDLIQVM